MRNNNYGVGKKLILDIKYNLEKILDEMRS